MKVSVVVGTRGELVGMAPVIDEILRRHLQLIFVHTGQHYNRRLRGDLLRDLELPVPNYQLTCMKGGYAQQIGDMLKGIERVLTLERPDVVLVQGNNNTTVAASLASFGLGIPIGHVESGIRHEYLLGDTNRRIVERIATYRFAPFREATSNLRADGIPSATTSLVGDTYLDAFYVYLKKIQRSSIAKRIGVDARNLILVSVHTGFNRREEVLRMLLRQFGKMRKYSFVWVLHPGIEKRLKRLHRGQKASENILLCQPLVYTDFQKILSCAMMVMTDSGVTQEESYLSGKPCAVLVNQEIARSPYPMLVKAGWIEEVKDIRNLAAAVESLMRRRLTKVDRSIFGNGKASERILDTTVHA